MFASPAHVVVLAGGCFIITSEVVRGLSRVGALFCHLMVRRMQTYLPLLVFVAITVLAAATGSIFMPGAWYAGLVKPSWTPPNWVFPIAWTVLYVMIAIAGWRAYRAEGIGPLVAVWAVSLIFNAAWSYIMFGRHEIGAAAVDVVALWLSIAAFIWLAWPADRVAAYLFMPYLVWVSYASALNLTIWRMN